MATCQFCGRQFTNTQAVRAHLKACAAYDGRDQAADSALGRVALGTVPEAADAGTELPNGEVARDGQKGAARLRAQERADRQAFREAEEFLRREAAERRARQRRAQIQSCRSFIQDGEQDGVKDGINGGIKGGIKPARAGASEECP